MKSMRKPANIFSPLLLGLGAIIVGVAEPQHALASDRSASAMTHATAHIHPTSVGEVTGKVRFEQNDEGAVTVSVDVEGLDPDSKHGFHIHEYGDCSHDEAESAGGHFNPDNHAHGLPDESAQRHAGDLGNLSADDQGRGQLEITVDTLTIAGSDNSVLGRSVIIHAEPDDGGQPTGNAGGRIGCGVIGIVAAE